MEKDVSEVDRIISGELIPGNHESIILLGSEPQSQLKSFSKAISEILLNDNTDLEYLIHDIIKEIDEFQTQSSKKSKLAVLYGQKKRRTLLIKQYNSVLAYIDKMVISLQLQEARLIKDSALMNQMQKSIEIAIVDMEKSITLGEKFVKERDITQKVDALDDWYGRLERRLEDLRVSHTVLLQSRTQLHLMVENDRKLVDKILSSLSSTIPIWRNQVTLLLGIEKMNRDSEVQEKIAKITEQYIKSNSKKIHNKIQHKEVDVEKLRKINADFTQSLNELMDMEENNSGIRLEMNAQLL